MSNTLTEYYKITLEEALPDFGINLSETKLTELSEVIVSSREMESEALGYTECVRGAESEAEKELRELKMKVEKKELWERLTKGCRYCHGNGTVQDVWGRDICCDECGGKGRVE